MKSLTRVFVLAALAVMAVAHVVAAPPDIAGPWQFTVELEMGTGTPLVTFKQDGEKITGTYEGRYGKSNLEGTIKENQIDFIVTVVAEGTTVHGRFTGVYADGKMKGDVQYEGAGDGSWSAVRKADKK